MEVDNCIKIVTDNITGARQLILDAFHMTWRDRVASLFAKIRYPNSCFKHHYPRWRCIPGWLPISQATWLFETARSLDIPGDVLEIGSAYGRSTVALALGTRILGRGKVYAVDPHSGGIRFLEKYGDLLSDFSSLGSFIQNLVRFGVQDIVVPIVLTSEEAARIWTGKPIRLLFIDGWHSYEACYQDILLWGGCVSPNGIMVIHDYDWEEVRSAVEDCIPKLDGYCEVIAKDSMAVICRGKIRR